MILEMFGLGVDVSVACNMSQSVYCGQTSCFSTVICGFDVFFVVAILSVLGLWWFMKEDKKEAKK